MNMMEIGKTYTTKSGDYNVFIADIIADKAIGLASLVDNEYTKKPLFTFVYDKLTGKCIKHWSITSPAPTATGYSGGNLDIDIPKPDTYKFMVHYNGKYYPGSGYYDRDWYTDITVSSHAAPGSKVIVLKNDDLSTLTVMDIDEARKLGK